jgi:hypothetical protein
MRSFAAVAIALALLGAPSAAAKKMGSSLETLTKDSEVIVVGRVVRVFAEGSYRFATLRVDAELKGPGAKEVTFVASRTWSCDESFAVEGEQLFLFLASDVDATVRAAFRVAQRSQAPSPIYSITHSGAGRMPIVEGDDDVAYALFVASFIVPKDWDEVRLPNHERDATPLMPALAATTRCIATAELCTQRP